jgi:hypothetical protein
MSFHDDHVYMGYPDRNEIRVLDRNGDLVTLVRGAEPLRPVTDAMKDAFRDAVIRGDSSQEPQRREYMEQASFAEVVPAFS